MDENLEKKPKRPRIGAVNLGNEETETPRYEKVEYNRDSHESDTSSEDRPQGYSQRPYQRNNYRQGGYQQRYQQRPPFQRYNRYGNWQDNNRRMASEPEAVANHDENNMPATENQQGNFNQNQEYRQQGGYRQGGYRQQGGYNRQQGGYRQGGYRQQGGYNRQQGGYRQGGYNRQQGDYNQQGDYRQQRGYNQQGGYGRQQGGYNRQGGFGNKNYGAPKHQMRFTPRPQPVEYEEPIIDPNMQLRLNKFLANAGVCSRREADELIQKGLVKVNGEPVTELGYKITPKDIVEYDDKVITTEKKCYILLNKPKDCVTTSDDPKGRKTVLDFVKGACDERIYPVGRLDRNTTGVLLLTNDGDLASKLTHPKYVKKKIYQVWTDKPITEEDMQHIADGVELDDGPIHADAVSYVSPTDRKQAGIEIHSGRNRVVRRIFEALGYHVVKLDRVYFAGLTKKNLPRGRWRYLTQEEVNFLKQNSFE